MARDIEPTPGIITLLAHFIRAKLRLRCAQSHPTRPVFPGDDAAPRSHVSPVPLSEDERPFYSEAPLDHRGAPHIRSQLASFVSERAAIEAGRMKLFSFDDDINALHYIARYERAGVGHLAQDKRETLAAFRAREITLGKPYSRLDAGRDYDSEHLMQCMYGSPEDDRARILQFHKRCDERDAAARRGLPARYSRYEPL